MIMKSMLMVGSSTAMGGSGSGFSISAMVSPISKPSMPTTAQMSPHWTSSTLALPRPSKTMSCLILDFSIISYLLQRLTGIPVLSVPRVMRPTAIRPTYGLYSRDDTNICGVPSFTSGAGISSRMVSRRVVMLSVGFFQSDDIQPCLALP